jgi:hypothetical protein
MSCPTIEKYINLKGLPNKIFSCMRCHWHRKHDFAFENWSYLGEFEAEFKKARESGAQGVIFDEKKTEGKKTASFACLQCVYTDKFKIRYSY